MSNVYSYLWLIPVLPFVAAAITMLGSKWLGKHAHWPCVLGVIGSAALAIANLTAVTGHNPPPTSHQYYTWFETEESGQVASQDESEGAGKAHSVRVGIDFRDDGLTAIMLVTITFIGSLIAIFSIGYMHGEVGYPRFFAAVALFIFSMTILVLGDNFLLLFAGWEGVGLCSYLLIGFWFTKPSASAAARKAFLVTRIGDLGMMLGIILLWIHSGYQLNYDGVFAALKDLYDNDPAGAGIITAICLLLFCGAVGKSAQFPLHVWLPDAMEGPTPVSALIHAATMVTAGIYLLARCTPLFVLSPDAVVTVASLGGVTALLAALIALTQNDLKRVMAYSTLSQLGYMFMALGCMLPSGNGFPTLAVTAAIFHLFTHAFFKALLFLSSGSVMHAMGGIIDMRRFGGLKKLMPTTHWTFLCGALALAGIPLLSGFWSKDEILAALQEAGNYTRYYSMVYFLLLIVALVTAFLTAFYTFRAYFMTFHGEENIPPEAGHHAHESPRIMTIPLMILAFFALFIGAIVGPLTHWFSHTLLVNTPGLPEVEHHPNITLMVISGVLALAGVGLAWLLYMKKKEVPEKIAKGVSDLYQLSLNKFYIDELYYAFVIKGAEGTATASKNADSEIVDNLIEIIARVPKVIGSLFRPVQNGLLQFYALAMILGLTVFLIALARSL